ncbi:MAG: DUF4432 family protein [Pirellulales bacterium]|nr:DUF4432 family protein [Pirellulales bacterium]
MNVAQLGGIETSVLDNGPGRGVRIAWVNTGGGLRYKVVIDRGLDIADAEFLGQSLTWHSLTGVTAPRPAFQKGLEWLRGFYGGMLVSCGPLNVGGPFEENGEQYGLHGTHSNTAAVLESVVNPDLVRGVREMRITGLVRTARVFGPNIELHRTLTSQLGEPAILVVDEFVNRGNQRVPLSWLFHINFGYPLLEPEASTYCYRGKVTPLGASVDWFQEGRDYRTAPQPLAAHCGSGEYCCMIQPDYDAAGNAIVGLINRQRGMGLSIEFNRNDFPRMVHWQHWGPGGSYVGALEPTSVGVEGRSKDIERGWQQYLEPGERRTFRCKITATNRPADLQRLLELNSG